MADLKTDSANLSEAHACLGQVAHAVQVAFAAAERAVSSARSAVRDPQMQSALDSFSDEANRSHRTVLIGLDALSAFAATTLETLGQQDQKLSSATPTPTREV